MQQEVPASAVQVSQEANNQQLNSPEPAKPSTEINIQAALEMQDTQNTMDLDKSARTDNSQLDISAHSGTSGPKPKKGKKKKKKKPAKK